MLTPNPNECNSTLTSGTNNIYPYPYIDINDRGHRLRITHKRGRPTPPPSLILEVCTSSIAEKLYSTLQTMLSDSSTQLNVISVSRTIAQQKESKTISFLGNLIMMLRVKRDLFSRIISGISDTIFPQSLRHMHTVLPTVERLKLKRLFTFCMMSETRWMSDENVVFFSKRSIVIKLPVKAVIEVKRKLDRHFLELKLNAAFRRVRLT